jgi:hypothetical protein
MIGAKTLATLTLLLVGVAAALALGVLAPERLAARGWGTLFLAGCFAVLVGALMFRYWHLGEPSEHYFRWSSESTPWQLDEGHFLGGERRHITLGDNQGEAFDLPPAAQLAVTIVVVLLVALGCIDTRALELLGRFRGTIGVAGSSYCPDPTSVPPPVVDRANAPGCELVRRAFALGYATTLGDCEIKVGPAAAAAAAADICTRRQRDEPVLHYAWRLLDRSWSSVRSHTGRGYLASLRQRFDERLGHLGSLRHAQHQVLVSAPHATHHIWTNLPDPGTPALSTEKCADRYRWLAHSPAPSEGPGRPSRVFEHVLGQLLFEGRYEPAAGYCSELHIHWGAPADACTQLAADPDRFLMASAALEPVRQVLARHRVGAELVALGAPRPTLAPQAAISFQCYIEAPGAATRRRAAVTVAGQRFDAVELRVPPSPPGDALFIDRYDAVASLLVDGFHYGRLLSEAGLDLTPADGLEGSFTGHDFLLTRLYGLESVDLYLGPSFLAGRPDLLEVYPYQRHLKNYVQTFRRQYRRDHGRL